MDSFGHQQLELGTVLHVLYLHYIYMCSIQNMLNLFLETATLMHFSKNSTSCSI